MYKLCGLSITAGNSTVRGLKIEGFEEDGIELVEGGGNTIEGNIIGRNIQRNGGSGVRVQNSSGNTIGGITTQTGNTITGNLGYGVLVQSGAGNSILSNSFFNNLNEQGRTGELAPVPNMVVYTGKLDSDGHLVHANHQADVKQWKVKQKQFAAEEKAFEKWFNEEAGPAKETAKARKTRKTKSRNPYFQEHAPEYQKTLTRALVCRLLRKAHDPRHRPALHRRQRQVLRGRMPGGLHPRGG